MLAGRWLVGWGERVRAWEISRGVELDCFEGELWPGELLECICAAPPSWHEVVPLTSQHRGGLLHTCSFHREETSRATIAGRGTLKLWRFDAHAVEDLSDDNEELA